MLKMNLILAILYLVLSGISAYAIVHNIYFHARKSELNYLSMLVLFIIFTLIPVHFVATLEIFGIIKSVSLGITVMCSCVITLFLIIKFYILNKSTYITHSAGYFPIKIFSFPIYISLSIIFIISSMLLFSINLLTSYPSGWDALHYHYPVAVRWLQEKSMSIPISGAWTYSLPSNAEIGMMIMLATGYQALATSFNIVTFFISMISIYIIAFRIVNNKIPAILSALLFGSVPLIQFQVFNGYVDLYGSSFILAGIAILFFRFESPPIFNKDRWYVLILVLSGCAWGVALGTKPNFYVYCTICLVVTSLVIYYEHRNKRCHVIFLVFILMVSMLLSYYFWPLRAIIASGNPVYPLKVEILGRTIFEGLRTEDIAAVDYDLNFVRSKIEWFVYPWVEYKSAGYNYSEGSGLGAIWATFVPVGFFYGLFYAIYNRHNKEIKLYVISLVLFLFIFIIWWIYLRRIPRYGLIIIGGGSILTAPLFDFFVRKQLRIFVSLFLCSFLTTCVLILHVPAFELLSRIKTGNWQRSSIYKYPPLIDRLPEGSTILNYSAPVTMNFPLCGKNLMYRVIPRDWLGSKNIKEIIKQENIKYIVENYPLYINNIDEIDATIIYEGNAGQSLIWRILEIVKKRGGHEP